MMSMKSLSHSTNRELKINRPVVSNRGGAGVSVTSQGRFERLPSLGLSIGVQKGPPIGVQ